MARTVQLKVMLTEEERERLATEAAAWGETVSTYVRRSVREAIRKDQSRRQIAKTPGVG